MTSTPDAETPFSALHRAFPHNTAWSRMSSQGSSGECSNGAPCRQIASSAPEEGRSSSESTASALEPSFATVMSNVACAGSPCTRSIVRNYSDDDPSQGTVCVGGVCAAWATSSGVVHGPGLTRSASRTILRTYTTATETSVTSTTTDAACPMLLPRCLNTWLFVSQCASNTDAKCFCKSEDFIIGARGCIDSWSHSASDRHAATICLQGICAAYIQENPAIITAGTGPDLSLSSVPGFVCPHDRGPLETSQRLCTTVTYLPGTSNSTRQTLATPGQPTSSGPGLAIASATTVTLPLIYLGTSTVTHSRNVLSSAGATVAGSGSRLAMPSLGPFTYHPANASHGAFGGSSLLPSLSSTIAVQTVGPFSGGVAKLSTHPIGLSFGGLALAAIF